MISPVKIWRRQKDIRQLLGKQGKIITWTKVFVSGEQFKRYAPYPVALVELENGERVFGSLVDYSEHDLASGKRVIATLRKVRQATEDGVIAYGIKFRPVK